MVSIMWIDHCHSCAHSSIQNYLRNSKLGAVEGTGMGWKHPCPQGMQCPLEETDTQIISKQPAGHEIQNVIGA